MDVYESTWMSYLYNKFYFRAQRAKTKTTQNRLVNQVLQRGFLTLNLVHGINIKGNKEYWFVLTSKLLTS